MISEQIAEYWGSFKFKVDPTSVQKLDQSLKSIERRLNKFSANQKQMNSLQGLFRIDHVKVASDLNRSLKSISNSVTFTLKNFRVDEGALNRALTTAASRSRAVAPVTSGGRTTAPPARSGYTNTIHRNAVRSTGVAWHSALAGGGILSGFGLRALNKRLQDLEMQNVMMEGVTGSQPEAQSQLAYTRRLAGEVGTTTTSLTPMYTRFLASAKDTPLEKYAQSGFRSFMRYGSVMGLDQEELKGSMRALVQITN